MNLKGKRTYILAGLMAAAAVARGTGLIDDQTYETCYSVLGALALGALRAGVGQGVSRGPDPEAEVPEKGG